MFDDLAIFRADDPVFPLASRCLKGRGIPYPLGLNECQTRPSDRILQAMAEAGRYANFYPDPSSGELRAALGERLGLASDRVVVGAGSDELIFTLALVAGAPGKSIVHCDPCFPSYRRAVALTGAEPRRAPIRGDGADDVDALLRLADASTSMVVATTPSNPAGVTLAAEEVERLADAVPESTLLVVDEAYHEYAVHAGGPDALRILERRARGHWVVLRTFSKAHGLAGLRVGYALASSRAVAATLSRASPTFNVSRIAQAAAIACLGDEAAMRRAVAATAAERERLKLWCARAGLRAFDSVTNFVSVRLPTRATAAAALLAESGIASSPWSHPDFTNVIRIGVGGPQATDATISGLGRWSAGIRPREPGRRRDLEPAGDGAAVLVKEGGMER